MNNTVCGVSIPFRIQNGRVMMQMDESEKIKENLIHLLMTGIGERVMRRNYGGGIHELVHEPNNDALKALAQHQIATAIVQWEPRVHLRDLNISQQESTLFVDLSYSLEDRWQIQVLSVPLQLGGL